MKRPLTLVVVALFFLTSLPGVSLPAAYAESRVGIRDKNAALELATDNRKLTANPNILIPQELGSIEESFKSGNNKTIIYIQDAHSSLEAQENIAKIIQTLVKEKGIKTVFEEGYEGEVPSDRFFGFISERSIREKIAYYFLDQLKIGGAEYAHINRTKDFKLIGADSIKGLAENIAAYQKTFQSNQRVEKDLADLNSLVRRLSDVSFPKELKQQIRWRKQFDAGTLDLSSYLEHIYPLILKVTTASAFQAAYPNLWAIKMVKQSRNKKSLSLLQNVVPGTVFREIEQAEERIANSLLKSDDEREIYRYQMALALLQRLAVLQVTPQEYEVSKDSLVRLTTKAIGQFWVKYTHKTLVVSSVWEKYIQNSIEFYEIAKKREDSIRKTLDQFRNNPRENQAILVFGGFHEDGIKTLLKEAGFSYVVVLPRITKTDLIHEAYYQRLMTRGFGTEQLSGIPARLVRNPTLYTEAAMSDQKAAEILKTNEALYRIATQSSRMSDSALREVFKKTLKNRKPDFFEADSSAVAQLLKVSQERYFQHILGQSLGQESTGLDFEITRAKWTEGGERIYSPEEIRSRLKDEKQFIGYIAPHVLMGASIVDNRMAVVMTLPSREGKPGHQDIGFAVMGPDRGSLANDAALVKLGQSGLDPELVQAREIITNIAKAEGSEAVLNGINYALSQMAVALAEEKTAQKAVQLGVREYGSFTSDHLFPMATPRAIEGSSLGIEGPERAKEIDGSTSTIMELDGSEAHDSSSVSVLAYNDVTPRFDVASLLDSPNNPVMILVDFRNLKQHFSKGKGSQAEELYVLMERNQRKYGKKLRLVIYNADLTDPFLRDYRLLDNVAASSLGAEEAYVRYAENYKQTIFQISKTGLDPLQDFNDPAKKRIKFFRYEKEETGLAWSMLLYSNLDGYLLGLEEKDGFITLVGKVLKALIQRYENDLMVFQSA